MPLRPPRRNNRRRPFVKGACLQSRLAGTRSVAQLCSSYGAYYNGRVTSEIIRNSKVTRVIRALWCLHKNSQYRDEQGVHLTESETGQKGGLREACSKKEARFGRWWLWLALGRQA